MLAVLLGTASSGTLGLATAAGAASCNSSATPAIPAPLNQTFSNTTFDASNPLMPLNSGIRGCPGSNGPSGGSGGPGIVGQPGGSIGVNVLDGTFIGGAPIGPGNVAADIVAVGGAGGAGGRAGYTGNSSVEGGKGGAGGNGGAIAASIVGDARPDASGRFLYSVARAIATGGDGGSGGDANPYGIYVRIAGPGGSGGDGGTANLAFDGSISAPTGGLLEADASGGNGGTGGGAPTTDYLDDTNGGAGGRGGGGGTASVTFANHGTPENGAAANTSGIYAIADGGGGNSGGGADASIATSGGNGGDGGAGGKASATLAGASIVITNSTGLVPKPFGVVARADGGSGGGGGPSGAALGAGGGSGGKGGAAGTASAAVSGSISVAGPKDATATGGYGVLVQANGGAGGAGADVNSLVGQAGGGGRAGDGGEASLTLADDADAVTISTTMGYAPGGLVQSVGGGGGSGGSAKMFARGGAGAAGGNGGPVSMTSSTKASATVSTRGDNARALVAQSIGGGGGHGGDVVLTTVGGGVAIGGNGGLGGTGGKVTVNLGTGAAGSRAGIGGGGLLAQSVGGSGGSGGSAVARGITAFTLTIGGDAAGGGIGGEVDVVNADTAIATYGDHAAGIHAQSIGGGGGKGGAAASLSAGAVGSVAVAIGGRGGKGGLAGNVSLRNIGQIQTFGPDAFGIHAQSVGGGGGHGGAAAASAIALSASPDIPAVSVSVGIGGLGGQGNDGATVSVRNDGLVTTGGHGARALSAQSVGGGGGSGGDSSATAYSGGRADESVTVSMSVGIGGRGSGGGHGGPVDATSTGVLTTLGNDAPALFAQSVGGGGGAGGTGDSTSSSTDAKKSLSFSTSVGGSGGAGGNGDGATVANSGSIVTVGDGSEGLYAQSIGGGGGDGGGGNASASGGTLSVAVGVGGQGGAGGDGAKVDATNDGAILTRGADSPGISVQSTGGGGGSGGKGASTAGGAVSGFSNAQALIDALTNGLNVGTDVTKPIDFLFKLLNWEDLIKEDLTTLKEFYDYTQGGKKPDYDLKELDVAVSVGGNGGAAGSGGDVSAVNTKDIATEAGHSDGIRIQSVGGGGGAGGAATAAGSSNNDKPGEIGIGVGGAGGATGNGGNVTVTHAVGATVTTIGVSSNGILAMSTGGGGGMGSAAVAVGGSLRSIGIGVGGSQGAKGDGGAVVVTSAGQTSTEGKHSIGVLAQSIGGGGGLVRTMNIEDGFNGHDLVDNPQGRIADIHGVQVAFGGASAAGGAGGKVTVTHTGSLVTKGINAHGVFAQSVGGGGGLAVGGQVTGFGVDVNGAPASGGDGGDVTVTVGLSGSADSTIDTAGDGAAGVIAQSVGGGGGFGGDVSVAGFYQRGFARNQIAGSKGDGGAVTVTLNNARIATRGANAPAVFAQSVGGGGGVINVDGDTAPNIQIRGAAGGAGVGGPVSISVGPATMITAIGTGSAGILAQIEGKAGAPGLGTIAINIDETASVVGGTLNATVLNDSDAAAVRLIGGNANTIRNAGSIAATDVSKFYAIRATGETKTSVVNTGKIAGQIDLGGTGSRISNRPGGVMETGRRIDLGSGGVLQNSGTIAVGGVGVVGRSRIEGDLIQASSGVISIDVDQVGRRVDLLIISGTAQLAGAVTVAPIRLQKGLTDPVLVAEGGLMSDALEADAAHAFSFEPVTGSNGLAIDVDADFEGAASARSSNDDLKRHLQRIWDGGVLGFGGGYADLARIPSGSVDAYDAALARLSGSDLAAIPDLVWRNTLATSLPTDKCEALDAQTVVTETGCLSIGWSGGRMDHDGTGEVDGFEWDSRIFRIAAHARLGPEWRVGAAVGYLDADAGFDSGATSVDGGAVLAQVGLQREQGDWTVEGALGFAVGEFDTRRRIGSTKAKASPDIGSVGFRLKAAYTRQFRSLYVQPALEFDAAYVRMSGFTEDGPSPFNLKVRASESLALGLTPLVRVGARPLAEDGSKVDLFAEAGVSFTSGAEFDIDARFAAAPQSSGRFTSTLDDDEPVGRLAAGANVRLDDRLALNVSYGGSFAESWSSHSGGLSLVWKF